ncbi:MAG: M20/M25/M40 family metallo-hydrolase, partial [Kocuria sp.]|nr:M20/M25/M40 family metallo-hydrolase [Kocuria sp.]
MTPDSAPHQGTVPDLDLTKDVAELTADLLDVYSVSDSEGPMTEAIERALEGFAHLTVHRHGDTLVARTDLGRPERVVLAGHVDTVPLPRTDGARGTVPSEWDEIDGRKVLFGRGATDMKGGVAVQLALAARLTDPSRDITYVFYDHEEVSSDASGLGKLLEVAPELVTDADFAVLLEPTDGRIEGGCNGTMRFWVHATETAA